MKMLCMMLIILGVANIQNVVGLSPMEPFETTNEFKETGGFEAKSYTMIGDDKRETNFGSTSQDYCPLKYNDKCFFVGKVDYNRMTQAQAREVCESQGAQLANIYSKEHYFMMVGYLRNFGSKDSYINAWTGMTFNAQDKSVSLSDNSVAPFTKWYPGYPHKSFCCGIIMRVTSDYKSKYQYLHNAPEDARMGSVLCEK